MSPNTVHGFSIKTSVFEGPLELLLDLVERRKLLINDISLAQVTDEFMRQVSLMQEMSLPNTASFINLAATLLLVKSKSLLPILELTEDEETSIEDLEERLRKYQIIRDAAIPIQTNFGKKIMYAPQYNPPKVAIFVPDIYCTTSALQNSIYEVLANLPKKEVPRQAQIKVTISLEEMMLKLENRIRQNLHTKFSELHTGEVEKKVIIVSFLAVLELFKQGNLLITQAERFSDINIELEQSQTPQYY